MNTMQNPGQFRGSVTSLWIPLAVVALLLPLAGLLGCSDNRISLQQFMQAQQTPHVSTAPPTTQPAQTMGDHYMGPYRVGPGDVLGIRLTGVEQTGVVVPIPVRVDREGNIDLPIVGRVHVEGMEFQDVEKAIQNAYVPSVYRQAAINVELVKPEAVTVLVTGAVSQPGLVQLPRTQRNLLYAITGAGGASNVASGEVLLRRLRSPDQQMTFNLFQPDQLQQTLTMEPLQNGDVVIVQAAQPNAIFVGGLVMAPHVQMNPPGTEMNVLQVIAAAGGIRTDVTPKDMTLIRRMPDGTDKHVKLDVERIQKGKDPNITLAPGDILWVPETALTRAEEWFNKNIFLRAGATAVVTYNVTGLDFLNNNAKRASVGTNNSSIDNTFNPFGTLIRQNQLQNIQSNLPAPQ